MLQLEVIGLTPPVQSHTKAADDEIEIGCG